MNAVAPNPTQMPPLVEIIELKWLLAGEGVYIHVERLMSDTEYARKALARAAASASPTLRTAAARLQGKLGLAAE
jgi:predicted RNA-binding protein YlxR (DUF448 family)